MSRKYYLEGGIEYQPDSGELFVGGRIENLQSLENKLLQHFVAHPDELINKEQLYEVGWEGRIHGDNPLSKVISNLRSKLNDSPKNPKYIKTIPKKGFRFIAKVSLMPESTPQTVTVPVTVVSPALMQFAKIAGLSVAIVVPLYLTINSLIKANQELSPQMITGFKKITHSSSQERDPHLNFDGTSVIFSRTRFDGDLAQLYIQTIPGGKDKALTANEFDNSSARWHPDGKRILYHRFTPTQCELAVMELDDKLNVISDKMLMTCGKYTRQLGLSWGPDNSIYYTDIDIQFAARKIYRFDLNSGKRTLFADPPDSNGRGYYRVHYDSISNQIYALHSIQWYATEVIALNLNGDILHRERVNLPLFSISSYNGMPVFRAADNHIRYLDNGGSEILMQSPLLPIFNPNFTDGQQPALVFIGGTINNTQLIQIDFEQGIETPLTNTEMVHRLPVMSANNNLYFVSNEIGIHQVWRKTNGEKQELSEFIENRYIGGLAVSDDEQYLALYVDQDIHVYQLKNLPLLQDQPYMLIKDGVNPHFSPDGKTLWYSRQKQDSYYMESVNLHDKVVNDHPDLHGYLGLFDLTNNNHLIFRYEQPGCWQLKNGKLSWYANAPLLSSNQNTVLDNNVLTYFDDAETQLTQLDLATGHKQVLSDKGEYRYLTKKRGSKNQWVVTRKGFGNTDVYIAKY